MVNKAPAPTDTAARSRPAARIINITRYSIKAGIQCLPAGAFELGGTLICGAGVSLLTGAVEEMVTVKVTGEEPLNVNDASAGGVIEHDSPGLIELKVHCA